MDRYLFRGKRVDNGEWIQGYFFKIWEKTYILWGTTNDVPNMIEVDTNTIGQCTGSKDKNDKFIFEGDVLKCWDNDGEEYQAKVRYYGSALCVDVNGCDYDYTAIGWALNGDIEECEIISNIYDKKEG